MTDFVDVDKSLANTVVGSLTVLFDVSMSMLAEVTVTVFVAVGAAAPATSTEIVSAGNVVPAASGPGCIQSTSLPDGAHTQSVPAADTNVRPAGSVSVTSIGLASASGPRLETSIV